MELKGTMIKTSGLKEEDIFNNKYFILNKKLLKLVALWPYQSFWLKCFKRIILMVTIISMMIPQMIRGIEETFEKNPNSEIILENLSGFLYFQGIVAKFFAAILTEKKLRYVYEEIMKDWNQITDKNEKRLLNESANTGRYLTIIWTGYLLLTGFGFVTLPTLIPIFLNSILKGNETFPISLCIYSEYFIDEEKYFSYLLFHQLVAGITTVVIACAVDTSYVNCVQHVLALFKIVSYRLNLSFDTISIYSQIKDINVKRLEADVHNYVIRSIKMHQRLIEFVDTIQSAFNAVFFIICALLVLGISIFTVDLVWNLHKPLNLLRISLLWFGTILYMFYSNWPGQKLINSSEKLFDDIYACGWYAFPMKTKFLIRFMLLRSYKSCRLTAGPLLEMNFESCTLILQTAMSYFTVLTSLA